MRETKTGFGAKVKKDYAPGHHEAEGGLQPDDDDDDEDVGEDEEDDDDGEDVDVDDDDDEGVDTNF